MNTSTIKFFTGTLLLTLALGLFSFMFKSNPEVRDDLKPFYDKYGVDGSFVLYDQKKQKYIIYNKDQVSKPFTPASTFKIFNSLVALETKVVADEYAVFKWDGQQRQVAAWNADTDMRNAFKNSTVWYYQEIARRVGGKRMNSWLNKAKYGNADTSGGIDAFWLTGGLRITPMEQIGLLRKLHDDKLPFSMRSMNIVKDIMIVKDTLGYVLRAKAGLGKQGNQYVGWYVGYITTRDNTYYFSNCVQTDRRNAEFANARLNIVYDVLDRLAIVKK
nr:classD_beta_lactamase [uncultured bacterium]